MPRQGCIWRDLTEGLCGRIRSDRIALGGWQTSTEGAKKWLQTSVEAYHEWLRVVTDNHRL